MDRFHIGPNGYFTRMGQILWILAVILVVFGIVTLVRGQLLAGIALIIVGLLVGPGGVSIFT
jgi:4-amino-4-deoxy-L-arabinose transferase-like glycosyltransferase